MLTFWASLFQRVSGKLVELTESKSASKFIHRDELSKMKQSPSKQKSYCGDSFSTSKPLLKVKDEKDMKRYSDATLTSCFDGKASTIRVKVKMTKQEAARLLSKCKDGGILEFRDVARQLVDLPMNRVTVVSPFPGNNGLLDSIPEAY
ncbi:hypothetical protein REPUB_Repub08aG0166000 [Reevesia pubescens]